MQSKINLNRVLQSISELTIEEQFYIADVLHKRLIDSRRREIADRVKEAEENYRQGKIYSGDVERLMAMSEDD
jgi:SET domain-containing protein